jgi:hypothetical protein
MSVEVGERKEGEEIMCESSLVSLAFLHLFGYEPQISLK